MTVSFADDSPYGIFSDGTACAPLQLVQSAVGLCIIIQYNPLHYITLESKQICLLFNFSLSLSSSTTTQQQLNITNPCRDV